MSGFTEFCKSLVVNLPLPAALLSKEAEVIAASNDFDYLLRLHAGLMDTIKPMLSKLDGHYKIFPVFSFNDLTLNGFIQVCEPYFFLILYQPQLNEELLEVIGRLPSKKSVKTNDRFGREEKQNEARKQSVLVIDDEAIIRDLSNDILTDLGIPVFFAKDGEQGLTIFEKEQQNIGLVILDVIMPGMDGREVYYELRKRNPEIKIMITSGYSKTGVIAELLKAGVDHYVQKPFNLDELTYKIRELMT